MALLSVRDVTLRFGGIVALDGVSFDVEEGHISGLIGPNGAGKTTAFNVITRLYKPDAGAVDLDGESILGAAPHKIVQKGIARTFQNIQLFRTMSVLENVLVGAHGRGGRRARRRRRGTRRRRAARIARTFPAAALPYGTQKRVELARALVAKPRLLLLDEPAGGLNHEEVAELGAFIRRLRDDLELTILLVEHHMNLVMCISDHVNVLSFGRKIADGPPARGASRPRGDRGLPRERGRRRVASGAGEPDRATSLTSRGRARVTTLLELDRRRGALRAGAGAARRLADGRRRARSSPSSARTAPARRRPCARSPARSRGAGRSSSTGRSSRAAPRQPRKPASRTSRRGAAPSSTSP